MRTLFSLLCWLSLATFVVGVVSIIKPLKILRITNRRTGLFVVVGSFVALLFFTNARLSPEDKARLATDRQAEQAQEQAKAKPPEVPQTGENKQPDKAALLGALLSDQLQKSGSDVTVLGFDDVLVFDCTKALDPRTACYLLYKGYPNSREELKALQLMGIRKLQFQTERGVFSGYAWTKRIGG